MRPMSQQADKANKPMRLVMPMLPRLKRPMRQMKQPRPTRLIWPISSPRLTRPGPTKPTMLEADSNKADAKAD